MLVAIMIWGLIAYVAWAFYAGYLIQLLRERAPTLYAAIGSPRGTRKWARPFGSDELDQLILRRQFRRNEMVDPEVVRRLEIGYWLRWIQLLSVVLFAGAVLAIALGPHAP